MKRVLITGVNSYIGNSQKKWLEQQPDSYLVKTISLKDPNWIEHDFSQYDVIFHVAGKAHSDVGHVSDEVKALYYKVNKDLTLEVANKAKEAGVKQFIYMSSIIVYGNSNPISKEKVITRDTIPLPANFYGDSKLQAEIVISKLSSNDFKIAIIRPPMIYGKDSKGNYPLLSKISRKLSVFPKVENKRSMIHIDNLAEFIRLLIDNEEAGLFFPQNAEHVSTSKMVQLIAQYHGKQMKLTKLLNLPLIIAGLFPGKIGGLVNKAFGNLAYDQSLSVYDKGNYRIRTFEESIKRTEG
ncbi:NAD-dependent epimerase/dehydratase family protein [Cohnella thailandensis]|uniref:NAD-dependent epimerase/dehydratase family protein n=1 Tax=Cohnella thailandensis TaxID=557557 RepID=A0A841T8H3_9BACL|nr:NAD-dependent epimerase/dehydratase family protein [Cohnella thailandensis]MBB6638157.1 NAD-dependent epimerase/dehydratase family protein [Cohnella thailandensis]MBP1971918.1 UDP-glucose 4-epimerase [Cohnella thailandensis]